MKIAIINENSQAPKNGIIEAALKKVVEPMGHEGVNYGMYSDASPRLTYVQCGILAAILLNSGAADFVITGCDGTDGADDAAAGTVDLGHAQLDGLADHLAQIAALGHAGLGSGNEHADALDVDDDATLVFLGDIALDDGLVLNGRFDLFPGLAGLETLAGQADNAFPVVDMDNDRFDLVADMDDVFGLDGRIAGEIVQRDVGRVLGTEVDIDLGGTDSHDGACYLISIIQSFEGLLEKLGKILLLCSFNFQFFAHFVVYLLNYPRRR